MLYQKTLSLEGDTKLQFLHLFLKKKKKNKNDTAGCCGDSQLTRGACRRVGCP